MKYENDIQQNKKYRKHLDLINEYQLIYFNWYRKKKSLNKWQENKKKLEQDLMMLSKNIEQEKIELALYTKELEIYLDNRHEFDERTNLLNSYQLYVQTMNYNGLPYEILKSYLPLIEADVNRILHSIVNFNIEFVFYDDEQIEQQKKRQIKSNMGCIAINICYDSMKPYNVQLASGFEKFIINLAIRMTLFEISLTAKPNFLIIDEGWSCLDADNLNNIGSIINYIKMKYQHVIIISHLDELKTQADYVINIEKSNGYSYIKTGNKFKHKY